MMIHQVQRNYKLDHFIQGADIAIVAKRQRFVCLDHVCGMEEDRVQKQMLDCKHVEKSKIGWMNELVDDFRRMG